MQLKPYMITRRFTLEEVEEAATMMRKGGLVAIPTETVYGLATNAEDAVAVRMIFDKKDRDYDKPVSMLVTDMKMVEKYAQNIPEVAYRLAEKYWPGPLTMVLPDKEALPPMINNDNGTLGFRCPDHPLTLSIIEKAGVPLAAPSANPSGAEPPRTAQEVLNYFENKIEGIVDGGPCAVGVESTVLDLTGDEPVILREGGIPAQELLDFIKG